MSKTLGLYPLFLLALLTVSAAAAAEDEQTKKINEMCRQYAEEDKVKPNEMTAYMEQCVKDQRDALSIEELGANDELPNFQGAEPSTP